MNKLDRIEYLERSGHTYLLRGHWKEPGGEAVLTDEYALERQRDRDAEAMHAQRGVSADELVRRVRGFLAHAEGERDLHCAVPCGDLRALIGKLEAERVVTAKCNEVIESLYVKGDAVLSRAEAAEAKVRELEKIGGQT